MGTVLCVLGMFICAFICQVVFTKAAGARDCVDLGSEVEHYRDLGFVVVTPNGPYDGGDFGRYTPGTRTAGIQEAIGYALASNPQKSLWIAGTAGYHIDDPVYIPPAQDFTIDGGIYVLCHRGRGGSALIIDSAMNCSYRFGLITSNSTMEGAVVLVKPQNLLPIDTWTGPFSTAFDFHAEAILSSSVPDDQEAARGQVAGLVLDSSLGSILECQFYVKELVGHGVGVYLTAPSGSLCHNRIELRRSRGNATHIRVGDSHTPEGAIAANQFEAVMLQGSVREPTGVEIVSGVSNQITIVQNQGMAKGRDVVFGRNARDNLVYASRLYSGVTNEAEFPNNRVVCSNVYGFSIETPEIPKTGQFLTNLYPYSVEVIILDPGCVHQWAIGDVNCEAQFVESAIAAGDRFILGPGDKILFSYAVAPEWRWRAL